MAKIGASELRGLGLPVPTVKPSVPKTRKLKTPKPKKPKKDPTPKPKPVEEAPAPPPERLAKPLTPWKDKLEAFQQKLPRFMFRGFCSTSGGGDPRLNNKDGITPHAFLNGKKPTTIDDIENLNHNIDGHIGGVVNTHFSSWAADWSTAMAYTQWGVQAETARMAIIDTTLLEDHVKMYHVKDLHKFGLASYPYNEEYLAYGPISGPAYHCVPMRLVAKVLVGIGFRRAAAKMVTSEEVAQIKSWAAHFQSPDAFTPDAVIAVVAAELGAQHASQRNWSEADLTTIMAGLQPELGLVNLPAPGSGTLGLANRQTFHAGFPGLQLMMNLLVEAEKRIRAAEKKGSHSGTKLFGGRVPYTKLLPLTTEFDDEEDSLDDRRPAKRLKFMSYDEE